MRRPLAGNLPEPWLAMARRVAEVLAERGWIIGGAARGLALSSSPAGVGLACAAPLEYLQLGRVLDSLEEALIWLADQTLSAGGSEA